jgi:hypothetical protein
MYHVWDGDGKAVMEYGQAHLRVEFSSSAAAAGVI